jgi:hypothetical protein
MDDFDKNGKRFRKKNFEKKKSLKDISEEQKFEYRSKKQFKHKLQDIKQQEIWEDWENSDELY